MELHEYLDSFRSYVWWDGDQYHLLDCLTEYDYLRQACGKDYRHFASRIGQIYERQLAALLELAESCAGWVLYENVAILLDRPCEIHLDDHLRLHNPNGVAIKYRDGWGLYAWHGVAVPPDVIEHPERITVKAIDQERNAEVRRVKIEQYGFDRYVRDAKVREVQRDDFGVLYRRDPGTGEPPLVFVKVVDATPEPDGTRKEYVLPVSSRVQTAHQAVASTFGLRVEQYSPSAES